MTEVDPETLALLTRRLDNPNQKITIKETPLLNFTQEQRDFVVRQYIKGLVQKNYSFLTAKYKLNRLNRLLNTNYILNPTFFKKTDQSRLPDLDLMETYIDHVKKLVSKFDFDNLTKRQNQIVAIRFATITGLRVFELLNLKWSHVLELKQKMIETSLVRKYSSKWQPYYNTELNDLVDLLVPDLNLEAKVFPFIPQTITNLTKELYRRATGKEPPKGFGTHSNRYYLATKNINKNIGLVRYLLGHAKTETTQKYIKNQISSKEIDKAIDEIPFFDKLYKKK